MIDNIIEESYRKKRDQRVRRKENESEKTNVFHKIKNGRFKSSLLVNNKLRNANMTISSSIDNLLGYTVIDTGNQKLKEQIFKLRKSKFMSEPLNKSKKLLNKHLFKSSFSNSDTFRKTVIQELPFMKKEKNTHSGLALSTRMNSIRNKTLKNINRNISNNSSLNFKHNYDYTNSDFTKKTQNLSVNKSDTFFITKIPETNLNQNKTKSSLTNRNRKFMSKFNKLRKVHSLVKESNRQMLDIYTGLQNIKENKITTFNNIMNINPNSQSSELEKNKMERALRNIDKFLHLNLQKSQSVANINRRFRSLFRKIFENKKYTDEKFDPRTISNPLDKIVKGGYREIHLDNNFKQTLGQRIWIQRSTANIVSYGQSCEKIPDDVFYQERKRILDIYPKIEEEAKISERRKLIEKRNPLLNKLENNIYKLNYVFLKKYDTVKRIRRKLNKYKISV